ncbi:nucleoside triphosphate pyrophosphohydrolase [Methylomarinum sp. Ch1-1]|uniref:Nucleoside triphosphate pyrophosphohydrolase n=1 Tax=Methylomarinum roseum TaxID=3067653 RepID=A0AAU7NVD6_9GAMM|nr:nucleoside triphosphate pyrophosphohydrolase [Methylomarinum sp. Ch1-1]MDP4523058.1 nucleoside triphosphate pyrophosphohydrolase [Methylomarinum sp. Ch1-1]
MSLTHTEKLLAIMARLRHPQEGCPWDLKQDFYSLIPYTIEEAYEVADAIERNDLDDLCAELGDLLLQVVFHARLAEERGLFDFEQVAAAIGAKLVRRHPHVFADASYDSDEQRQQAWEEAKAEERKAKNKPEGNDSVLDGVAKTLPALVQCEKIQNRAASHGFDWPETAPVFDKVLEELDEVKEAWQSGDQGHIQEEVGDLLLISVNLARHLKVNPEIALKEATKKFSRRFHYIERQVQSSDRELRDCKLEELDSLWHEAKLKTKRSS